jgi:hypothetical protein
MQQEARRRNMHVPHSAAAAMASCQWLAMQQQHNKSTVPLPVRSPSLPSPRTTRCPHQLLFSAVWVPPRHQPCTDAIHVPAASRWRNSLVWAASRALLVGAFLPSLFLPVYPEVAVDQG